jgi:hypothetical protein
VLPVGETHLRIRNEAIGNWHCGKQ